jgi:hypothetical protein
MDAARPRDQQAGFSLPLDFSPATVVVCPSPAHRPSIPMPCPLGQGI